MNAPSTEVNNLIRPDSYLTLHYRIVLASGPAEGSVFADTFDGRPATLQMGSGQWAPGLEAALIGHTEGERFSVTLPPADAYGDRNPELIQRVTRGMLAEHAGEYTTFDPGDLVEFAAPNGGRYSGILKEINDEWALFDFNHPLAGNALTLDVAILGVL